jgi:mono/diheme cytochrome c family protein
MRLRPLRYLFGLTIGLILGLEMPGIASTPTPFSSDGRAATGTDAARALFRQLCAKCHGTDGTGSPGRGNLPAIPDFTAPSWHAPRSEAQLRTSILDGKGKKMPSFRDKIHEAQARELAAYVRSFATNSAQPRSRPPQAPRSMRDFEAEFMRLEKEMEVLQKQLRELPKESVDKKRSTTPAPAPNSRPSKKGDSQEANPTRSGSLTTPMVDGGTLFLKHCARCHGADGKGSHVRRRLPEVPDFTDPVWQRQRRDPQLLASILDGKGKEMPSWRGKICEKQARSLVRWRANVSGSVPFALVTGFFGGAVGYGLEHYTWPP